MSKRAIITGITGQDGSYLAELLLTKGYEVVGAVRRASAPNFWRIQHLLDRITIKPADLLDQLSLIRLIDACVSPARVSDRLLFQGRKADVVHFDEPLNTFIATDVCSAHLSLPFSNRCRLFQAPAAKITFSLRRPCCSIAL